MAQQPSALQKILAKIVRFFRKLVDRIQRLDRQKQLIILAVVVLLLLVIIVSAAVHGKKKTNKPIVAQTEPVAVYEVPSEPVTEPAFVSPAAVGSVGRYKVAVGSETQLNFRARADSESDTIGQIPDGTFLDVLYIDNAGESSWGYVEYDGQRGWVFMEYLELAN